MEYLKVKWKAKDKGSITVSFEDIGITMEDWEAMDDAEKDDVITDIMCSSNETTVYAYPTSYEVIDD